YIFLQSSSILPSRSVRPGSWTIRGPRRGQASCTSDQLHVADSPLGDDVRPWHVGSIRHSRDRPLTSNAAARSPPTSDLSLMISPVVGGLHCEESSIKAVSVHQLGVVSVLYDLPLVEHSQLVGIP